MISISAHTNLSNDYEHTFVKTTKRIQLTKCTKFSVQDVVTVQTGVIYKLRKIILLTALPQYHSE